jgi:hypothetical protein
VSSLFGIRPGRQDPELAAATRRRRAAFAKDIGDEMAFARDLQPTRRRRPLGWLAMAVVLLALIGGIPLFSGRGGLVPANCEQPAVGLTRSEAAPGDRIGWQVAGPRDGRYAVTLDGDAVVADGNGRLTAPGGVLIAGPFAMDDCRSSQALMDVPSAPGRHTVTLLHEGASGYAPVASASLQVG